MKIRVLLTAVALAVTALAGPAQADLTGYDFGPDLTVTAAPAATLTVGDTATFSVTVETASATEIQYQRQVGSKYNDEWETIEARPAPVGVTTYVFAVPTAQIDTFTLRFHVPSTAPQPSWAATSGDYPFTVNGLPSAVTMNPAKGHKANLGARSQKITGKVLVGAPRPVSLELNTPLGWMPLGTTQSDAAGNFSIPVPTDWRYSGTVRVGVPQSGIYAAAGSDTTFPVQIHVGGKPRGKKSDHALNTGGEVRWDPCEVIAYKVNTTGAPKGAMHQVKKAFKMAHVATGLRFRYAGPTDAIPYRTDGKGQETSDVPFTVAWASGKQVRDFRGGPRSPIGLGGWQGDYDSYMAIGSGGVAIARGARVEPGFGVGQTMGSLLLHEIGHAIGLDHAYNAPTQIMYPALQNSHRGQYEAGDLEGLRKLGATNGCIPTDSTARVANARLGVPEWHVSE